LVHESHLKNGSQFSLETQSTVETVAGRLLLNPRLLVLEVRAALQKYVGELINDSTKRANLAKMLKRDHAADFSAVASH
jgi:hypothetical protein